MERFIVLKGGEKKKPHQKQDKDDIELWVCRIDGTCDAFQLYKPYFQGNAIKQGYNVLVCARCFVEGRNTSVR